jgi:hypothetical protein
MLYVALLLMFVSGFIIGALARDTKPDLLDFNKDGKVDINDAKIALDVNHDGKVDQKDLDIAKAEIKKAASTVQGIASQVKKK